MESKANGHIEYPIVIIECDIKEEPISDQWDTDGNQMKPKRTVSLPVSIPVMENIGNKEQKPGVIQWTKGYSPEIRHNLPFTPMPVRQTYLQIKKRAEQYSTTTQQNSVIKEHKSEYDDNIIQLTDDKMVQTDASGSPNLDDQDNELLKFYKMNKIPPRQIISLIKNSKYFTDTNLNKEVSNLLEQKEDNIKMPNEEEPNKKVTHQEEKEQGIIDKLLELSENNKQILLKYFENENKLTNTEQVRLTPLTGNTDSALNITNTKEYNDHLRRSILFEIYQLFKGENNIASKRNKRNASAIASTPPSSSARSIPQPPPKRATVSTKYTKDYHESQTVTSNMATAVSYNNIQQCPAPQYGYNLHENDRTQINTMPPPQAVAPYPVRPRIPSHYPMARSHAESASLPNPMQIYHQNMQPSANANQLFVRPQEPLQMNQQNVQLQMEHQGYQSQANQHIINEQLKSQQENWRRLQHMQAYRQELEQQKLPAYYPNTQWSEYQRRV